MKVSNKHKTKVWACALAAAAASAAHCVQTEAGPRLQPAVFRGGCVCVRILLLELLKQQNHKPKAQSPGVVLHFRAHASKEIKMLDEESGARRDATRDARDFRNGARRRGQPRTGQTPMVWCSAFSPKGRHSIS